jgi:uncharacterized protein DUF4136
MTRSAFFVLVLGLAAASTAAQTPKYGVTATADKKADFSTFKTYTWEHGWQAPDKSVHAAIVAAIERELAAVGLEKRESGTSDLVVTYGSLRRIDVDLKSKPDASGMRRQYDVGTLVVLLLEPGTRRELFRGRVDEPIEIELEKAKSAIDAAVAAIFAKYPARAPR